MRLTRVNHSPQQPDLSIGTTEKIQNSTMLNRVDTILMNIFMCFRS